MLLTAARGYLLLISRVADCLRYGVISHTHRYFAASFGVQYHMKSRKKPYDMKNVVVIHNAFLCLLSLVMFVGVVREVCVVLFSFDPPPHARGFRYI
jgi:hypothetical protein